MKKILNYVFILLGLAMISSCASIKATAEKDQEAKKLSSPDDKALVYFINRKFTGTAVKFMIKENEKDIGTLKSKTYIFSIVDPGKHIFTCKMENEGDIIIDAEAGKTYYVELIPKMGWLKARVALELIHPIQAQEYMKKCTLSKECADIKRL